MARTVYRPGDTVPGSGIYRIEHHKHRLMHEVTLTEGMLFPQCRTCKAKVRFYSVRRIHGPVLPFRPTEILEDYPETKANGRAAC
jgi:hypothetical protein